MSSDDIFKKDDTVNRNTGKPFDKSYLEKNLPSFLVKSIERMMESWKMVDNGQHDLHWDLKYDDLYSDINYSQVEQLITSEQADYLRKKYLRMGNDDV